MWPEPEGVRWWTAESTGVWTGALPPLKRPDAPEACSRGLGELLPQTLSEGIGVAPVCRLLLDPALGDAWQQYAWEWLRWQGQPLVGRLLAARAASPLPGPGIPAGETAVIRLWPRDATAQPFGGLADRGGQVVATTRAAAETWLAEHDPTALAALVVIAHGAESGEFAFLDERGQGWRLDTGRGLPPLVALLACAGRDGNLLAEGRRCLDAGARAVLASAGRLDATQIGDFIRDLLAGWREGVPVGELLRRAQGRASQQHGAGRLCLLGQYDLRQGTTASASRDALPLLLGRLTRERWREGWTLDQALAELETRLDLPADYAHGVSGRDLLHKLRECEPKLPRLTRAWVLGLMAYLAEIHHHALLPRLARERTGLPNSLPEAATEHHYWAKVYYRQGQYRRALVELDHGLAQDDRHPALLGLLANCLLDLNLPKSANRVLERLDNTIADPAAPTLDRNMGFKFLDRRARLCLRQGRPRAAVGHYRRKHEEALGRDQDGQRERAGLLYAWAWLETGGEDCATAAIAVLDAGLRVGQGNTAPAYLLRALALWAWRRHDHRAAKIVVRYRELLQQRLAKQDPGPFGMALGFLRLYYRQNTPNSAWLVSAWDEVRELLENGHYWLELATLHHLAKERDESMDCLDRFQCRRRQALKAALPAWVGLAPEQRNEREAQERRILGRDPNLEELVKGGLMPL